MSEEIESLKKGLRVLKLLPAHAVLGIANQEIAQATGITPPNVTRIVNTLVAEGWAMRLETGRVAPSVSYLSAAISYFESVDRVGGRLTELRHRVSAGANQING